jgi:hypothetical protein
MQQAEDNVGALFQQLLLWYDAKKVPCEPLQVIRALTEADPRAVLEANAFAGRLSDAPLHTVARQLAALYRDIDKIPCLLVMNDQDCFPLFARVPVLMGMRYVNRIVVVKHNVVVRFHIVQSSRRGRQDD